MNKFKPGDKVKRVRGGDHSSMSLGSIGVITCIQGEYMGIKEFPHYSDTYAYRVKNYDLVLENVDYREAKVRIIKEIPLFPNLKVGKIISYYGTEVQHEVYQISHGKYIQVSIVSAWIQAGFAEIVPKEPEFLEVTVEEVSKKFGKQVKIIESK